MSTFQIESVTAREVLDSRGFPTVEADVVLVGGIKGRGMVPSGASTGEGEAIELRDGDAKRYLGKGVLTAVDNVRKRIAPAIMGRQFPTQQILDRALCELDGTPNKGALGANAILAVSMAFARARAQVLGKTLYQSLAQDFGALGTVLPVPLMNILNGGKHADNGLAIQEFMIVPAGFTKFSEALRAGVEVFHRLKKILASQKLSTGVGDEGGFAPTLPGDKPHEQVLGAILQAIKDAGFVPGKDIFLALDCAASEFVAPGTGTIAGGEAGTVSYRFEGQTLTSQQMIDLYERWCKIYPIVSIEDGLSEHDWSGWKQLTSRLGSQIQLVGDDLFVTNPVFLKKGIENKSANSILIKLNQIGTVTETLETMNVARGASFSAIASHRSGETEDTFIADLAVATHCGQIKTGSASRTDRIAKYNQLLRIEEELGARAQFRGIETYATLKK